MHFHLVIAMANLTRDGNRLQPGVVCIETKGSELCEELKEKSSQNKLLTNSTDLCRRISLNGDTSKVRSN